MVFENNQKLYTGQSVIIGLQWDMNNGKQARIYPSNPIENNFNGLHKVFSVTFNGRKRGFSWIKIN